MAKAKRKKQDKYAKHKVAAIPLLLAVLGYVMLGGESDSKTPPKTKTSKPSVALPVTTQRIAATSESSEATAKLAQKPWPEADLAFLDGPNPFIAYDVEPEIEGVPEGKLVSQETAPDIEAIDVQELLGQVAAELRDSSSSFSFRSQKKNVIVIGPNEYQVGDEIRDRVFIQAIRGGKIVLEYQAPDLN